jgi:nitric oxide dioxygenase
MNVCCERTTRHTRSPLPPSPPPPPEKHLTFFFTLPSILVLYYIQYFAPRHYTLTSQPSDPYYQITVKALKASHFFDGMFRKVAPTAGGGDTGKDTAGMPDGEMSGYLHSQKHAGDIVKLGPVFGPDVLAQGDAKARPVACFISAGIGITPTWSMLPTAMKTCKQVCVFHGDESAKSVPFQKEIINLLFSKKEDDSDVAAAASVLSFSYRLPADASAVNDDDDDDKVVQKYYSEGDLTADKICTMLLAEKVDYKKETDYYVCAGASTTDIVKGLWKHGVDNNYIHTEFFGPFASVEDDE